MPAPVGSPAAQTFSANGQQSQFLAPQAAGFAGPAQGQSNFSSPPGMAPAAMRGGSYQYMAPVQQDRLLRQETQLGVVREIVPPEDHIGLSLFPFLNVPSDDVIFDYAKGITTGLAPARAEDAESELAQKDAGVMGQGRASVIDWAIKDHYDASDVTRYRDLLQIAEQVQGGTLPLTLQGDINNLPALIARDTAERRRRLDNRIEWMLMTSISAGALAYNDGRIKFGVDWERPADQHNQAPASGTYAGTTHDPIGDIRKIQRKIYNRTGVKITRALCSNRFLNSIVNSDLFIARSGFAPGTVSATQAQYVMDGWGPQAAIEVVQRQTGITFIEYDSGYRTKPIGGNNVTFNRFTPEDQVIFLPDESQISQYDSSPIGLGKILTSPHPMGGFTPGFYEWEQETTDPWGRNIGTGIKAFPVFPHMDLTYTMKVTLPPEL